VFPLPTTSDNLFDSKEFQALGDCRKVIAQSLGKFRYAHFSLGEECEELQSAGVSQSPKDRCGPRAQIDIDQRFVGRSMRVAIAESWGSFFCSSSFHGSVSISCATLEQLLS
jgi:hypothetical protein